MDNVSSEMEDFETILSKRQTIKPLALYKDNNNPERLTNKPQDIINSVNSQINAMQAADNVKSGKFSSNISHHTSEFRTVANLPGYSEEIEPNVNIIEFETQLVSDTQLINVIKAVEIQKEKEGMTQEFELSFNYNACNNQEDKNMPESCNDSVKDVADAQVTNYLIPDVRTNYMLKNSSSEKEARFSPDLFVDNEECCKETRGNILKNSGTYDLNYTNTSASHENKETFNHLTQVSDFEVDSSNRNISDNNKINSKSSESSFELVQKSKTLSPFVCNLDSFERFETVALPIINENENLSTAKYLINSQILSKIHNWTQPINDEKEKLISSSNIKIENLDFKSADDTKQKQSSSFQGLPKLEKIKMDVSFKHDMFNSDEEENYVHKKSQDLPFTCALETSFYDQFDILDKTMYVGFQTASNKSIQVYTESFNKAKTVLNDLDINTKKELTLTELVEKCNSLSNHEENEYKGKFNSHADALKNDNAGTIEESYNGNFSQIELSPILNNKKLSYNLSADAVIPKENNVGFVTANNKNINLSDTAVLRCKSNFQGIDLEDEFATNVKEYFENDTQERVDMKSQFSKRGSVEDLTKPLHTIDDEDILNEFQFSEIFKDTLVNKDIIPTEAKDCQSTKVSEGTHSNNKNYHALNKYKATPSSSNSFQTASNKNITVTAESVSKTKDIIEHSHCFDDAFNKVFDCFKVNKANFSGFVTASNKKISVCQEAFTKTKNIFQDIDETIELEKRFRIVDNQEVKFKGFKTASNKQINISDKALANTAKLFQDIILDNVNKCKETSNINKSKEKSSNKRNHNSTEQNFMGFDKINESKTPPINDNKEDTGNSVNKERICFKGFQTASNKTVKISAQSLAKSKHLFQDLHLTGSNKFVEPKPVNTEVHAPTGFQTDSNKKVVVSADALIKSKNIFENFDQIDEININPSKDKERKNHISDAKTDSDKFRDRNVNNCASTFNCFQTATNKKVTISEEALAKCKQIFQDIDFSSQIDKNNQIIAKDDHRINTINSHLNEKKYHDVDEKVTNDFGFKTAAERKIIISHEGIRESKFLSDTNVISSKVLLENIDTQVLKNYENTLNTEDFYNKSPKNKRSASPILSCPRAKKIKFKIPTSNKKITTEADTQNNVEIKKTFIFNEDYKKSKVYTLKDIQNLESKCRNVNLSMGKNKFEDLLDFEFSADRNAVTDGALSVEGLKDIFSNSVNQKYIPDGWLNNHLKLILWKLLSYEILYPNTLGTVCTVGNVLNQLKYRYDKELYNVERPALRKILEKDDFPSKTLILCVMEIIRTPLEEKSISNSECKVELLVTDGWYCVKACLDKMLIDLVHKKKIVVGTKLVTNGAVLLNCDQGISPLEDTSAIRLKLSGNSTRRARWDAKLGFHRNVTITTKLSQMRPDGGKISKVRVLVTRVYPVLYIEKFEDGNTITRSERLEDIHAMKYESERQMLLERLYEEVEREVSDQEFQISGETSNVRRKRKYIEDCSPVSKYSDEPTELADTLTASQSTSRSEDNMNRNRENLLRKVQAKLLEKMEAHGLCRKRNVVTLLKVRVAGIEEGRGGFKVTRVLMSIWKPNESILELIKEGAWIDVRNVVPTSVRSSEIHISAGRQSMFSKSKIKENDKLQSHNLALLRKCYHIKELIRNPTLKIEYNEIDTVGIIISIEPSIENFGSNKNQFQNVFLADENKNMICVNFWGGLKKFGYDKVLDTGQIVACVNLQNRTGCTAKSIPQFRVTKFTYFTKSPRNIKSREMVENLNKTLVLDRRTFCENCVALKNNVAKLQDNENITPYRINNVTLKKNKMFIDTPAAVRGNADDFDITGLDFESPFQYRNTQDLSPKALLRRNQVQQKIKRLKIYGEPSPLTPIHIRNKKNIKYFKSPLATLQNNVASTNNISANCQPLNNPTYVHAVNPVKIDFDKEHKCVELDYFAEEFDGSLPLSLE